MYCLTSPVGTGVAADQLKSCTIAALANPLTSHRVRSSEVFAKVLTAAPK